MSPRLSRTLAFALLLLAPAGSAVAATYSITGNARFQVGNGLPSPIGLTPAPGGRVVAIPGATIQQDSASPRRITLPASRLVTPGTPLVLGIAFSNPNAFQIATSQSVRFPRAAAVFSAGGRTGMATEVIPVAPSASIRYTSTSNQFGGPARPLFAGKRELALAAGASAPCTGPPACVALFASFAPAGQIGGPLGASATAMHPAASPGAFVATVTALGKIQALGTPLAPGLAVDVTSVAGPWTTGRVTVSVPSAVGVT